MIEVGEYVRTDNGIIGKYIIQQNINYIDTGKQFIGIDIEKDIVKNSPNIIELIEKRRLCKWRKSFCDRK